MSAEALAGHYYVTVRDGSRAGFLLGPYAELSEARANVKRGEQLASAADPFAGFYAYGTARDPRGARKTVFGR